MIPDYAKVPAGWILMERRLDGAAYRRFPTGKCIAVIASDAVEQDGRRWVHLSMSHPDHLPTWREVVAVRNAFLGPETRCIQIVPPASSHVNIHEFCLHLWHCHDGDALPDFTHGKGSI